MEVLDCTTQNESDREEEKKAQNGSGLSYPLLGGTGNITFIRKGSVAYEVKEKLLILDFESTAAGLDGGRRSHLIAADLGDRETRTMDGSKSWGEEDDGREMDIWKGREIFG